MVDQIDTSAAFLEQDVTALAVGVVDQQVEQSHRAQALAVGWFETEIVDLGIMFNVLLQGPGTEGAVAQEGERDKAKT